MPSIRNAVLAIALCTLTAQAQDLIETMYPATGDVPDGAKVTLELDQPNAFLGENVLVHFVLQNTSDKPITFSYGGDYRGATRALRFHLTATDEKGNAAPDPDPDGFNFGGLGGDQTLEPGAKWIYSLALPRHALIDQPGTYTLRAWHDLGWRETKTRKRPVGETKITLAMPDEAQAETIVTSIAKLEKDPSWSFGEKRQAYADFGVLRHPVYLKPLEKLLTNAQPEHAKQVIEGIGSIQSTDATATLVKLLEEPPAIANLAATQLIRRLPNNLYEAYLTPASRVLRDAERKRSWDDKFVAPIRKSALAMLDANERERCELGATMLACVGTADDQKPLLLALDRELMRSSPRRGDNVNLLDPPGAANVLLRSLEALAKRGVAPPAPTNTAAELSLHLRRLLTDPKFRPAGWEKTALGATRHTVPYIRELAVRVSPVADASRDAVLRCFDDPDQGVVRAACEYAIRSKDVALKQSVLKVIATGREDFLLNDANNAAVTLGAKAEACEIWVTRLDEPKMLMPAMQFLSTVVKYPGGGTGGNTNVSADEIAALKTRWQAFVAKHRERIAQEKLFEVGDPELTPDLFGRVFSFGLKDGSTFPPREER